MNDDPNRSAPKVPRPEGPSEASQPARWVVPPALSELWEAGQSEVVIELLHLFLSDTAERLGRLREALGREDFDELRRMAHSIKGSCSQMGEEQMALLGRQLEERAKAESLPGSGEVLEQLVSRFEVSSRAMRVFLENHA